MTPLPLSQALREGSASAHRDAESSGFMAALVEGRLPARAHTDLLLRLRPVYAALEAALRGRRNDPIVAAVHDPALERLGALDADLAHWAPGEDPDGVDSPAAAAYVAAIAADADRPAALLAHHYTRYLGDLSGGRIIGSAVRRTYLPPVGLGSSFYEFPASIRPKPYKDAYRARIDALDLAPGLVRRTVDDVRGVFALNQRLFDELGALLPAYGLGIGARPA